VRNAHYVPRRDVQDAFLECAAFDFDAEVARDAVGWAPGRRLILCEEGLSGYLHHGGMMGFQSKEVAHRLREALPDAHIVIFLRAQDRMIAACYQQYVRGGGTHSASRYLFPGAHLRGSNALRHKNPRFSFEHFEYDRLVAHYEALFGTGRVHVFAYEAFRDDARGFLEDFARELSLDVDLDAVPLARRENRSYSRPVMALARGLNRFTSRTVADKHYLMSVPGWYWLSRRLLGAINDALPVAPPTPAALLGAETAAWIRDRYAAGNRRLVEAHGLPLARYGYPLAEADGNAAPERRAVRLAAAERRGTMAAE
jgi:hypothetical protein